MISSATITTERLPLGASATPGVWEKELRKLDLVPDLIMSSTAKRARSTAKRVAKACGFEGEIIHEPSLYFQGVQPYLDQLMTLSNDAWLVFGRLGIIRCWKSSLAY